MVWIPDIVLYHADCIDGFTAAWAAYQKWGVVSEGYVPVAYNAPLPDLTGLDVLMLDFSVKRDTMIELVNRTRSLVILDHHDSAEKELWHMPENWDNWRFTSDFLQKTGNDPTWSAVEGKHIVCIAKAMSGALLTWYLTSPEKNAPTAVKLVSYYDLWQHDDPRTVPFHIYLQSQPKSLEGWLSHMCEDSLMACVAKGEAIQQYQDLLIKELAANTHSISINGHDVPATMAPHSLASRTGHEILKEYPLAPFVCVYYKQDDGTIKYSLRSDHSRLDVSEIARKFGGGGHRNAAGFVAPD